MRHPARILAVCAVAGMLALASCGRSSGGANPGDGTDAGGTTASLDASFGTTKVTCGPNKTGEALTASDQGVTADSINLATISDVGFASRPGLNQELFDASEVFANWCNDLGGINGRKVKVDQRDAAVFNYKAAISDSCTTDFALVGGGGVFDDAGQVERLKCLLPNFAGYVVSSEARGADLTVQAVPNPADAMNVGGFRYVKAKFPDSVDKVGFVAGNVPSLQLVKSQSLEVVRHLGGNAVDETTYNPLGEASWTPIAQNLKQKGVKGVIFVGEPVFMAKLYQAMATIDYTPDWVLLTANFYDPQLIDEGGDAVRNAYITLLTTPYLTTDNAAMNKYKALFEHYLPKGKKQAVLGQNSFSSWILFAQAASECGAKLTRKCAYENAMKVTDFDAGGFQAPTNPSKTQPSDCFTLVTVADKQFKQIDVGGKNGSIWKCDPENVLKLTGDYGKGTTFADAGTSLAKLP